MTKTIITASSRSCRPLGRRGQVEVQVVVLGEMDELPVVGEAAAVAVAEVLEDDLARFAEARWHLEQLHEILGGQAAGERFAGNVKGRKWRDASLDRPAYGRGDRGCPNIHFGPAGIGKEGVQGMRPMPATNGAKVRMIGMKRDRNTAIAP